MKNKWMYWVVGLITLAGCLDRVSDAERSRRLIELAQKSAAEVIIPKERLTRQLNIAEVQLMRQSASDAQATLAAARKTITDSSKDQLDDYTRLAGWVSISQLSRRANDPVTADVAITQAISSIKILEPKAQRCDYVISLAGEVREVRGKAAAGKFLAQAAPWALEKDNKTQHRQILLAFAREAFFQCDAFDDGRVILQQDSDAGWQSDMLLAMATPTVYDNKVRAQSEVLTPAASAPVNFKSLSYESNFQQQRK